MERGGRPEGEARGGKEKRGKKGNKGIRKELWREKFSEMGSASCGLGSVKHIYIYLLYTP